MRSAALLVVVPLFVACTPPGECASDEDCPAGEECRPLQETGELVCIRPFTPSDGGPDDEGEPVAISSFTADDTSVPAGTTVTLSWTTQNATSCAINEGIGAVVASGSVAVTPARTTEYTLGCQGAGGPALADVVVAVIVAIEAFAVVPDEVNSGGEVTVSWQTVSATACTLSGPGLDYQLEAGELDDGEHSFAPSASGDVVLTCEGAEGPATESASVAVARITSFTATPPAAAAGDEITLAWTTDQASACAVDGVTDANPADSQATVTVTTSAAYTLTCEGFGGADIQATASVPVLIESFAPADASVSSGGSTTLSFAASEEVASCTIDDVPAPLGVPYDTGALTTTTSFTLVCRRGDGLSASAETTVTVN